MLLTVKDHLAQQEDSSAKCCLANAQRCPRQPQPLSLLNMLID